MATIFKREEKADILFEKILQNPEACRRLTETFYSELNIDPDILEGYLPPEKFARALFSAYKNRDITELLMAICQNSMFDLLRNSFLAPFRFDEKTMDVVECKMGEHIGILLVYELPDSVLKGKTEAEAYAAVWDILLKLQKELPRSFVFYGQDSLEDKGTKYDELGVFLPIHKFAEKLEKRIERVDKIVYED